MATNQSESSTRKPLVADAQRGTVCVGVAFATAWKTYTDTGAPMPCTPTANGGVQCYVYHYGSGWFFHDSGLVLTCEHVRQACRRHINAHAGVLVVCPYKGPTTTLDWSEAWKAEVVAHTANWDGNTGEAEAPSVLTLLARDDAAVLRIKSSLSTGVDIPATLPITVSGSPLKILRLSETVLEDPNDTGQELASLGFPPAGGLESATPTFVRYSEKLDDTFLKLTGSEMMGGHSGGPLVTMSGVVVGWNVRNDPNVKLYSHCKMIAVARECIKLTLPPGVTWSNLLATKDEEKAHEKALAAITAKVAAVAEQSAMQAAGRAGQSAQGAASSRDDAASQAAAASASKKRARSSETAAAVSAGHAAVSAAHAVGAASTLIEVRGKAARQAETVANVTAVLRAAIQGMDVGDSTLQAAFLFNATATVRQAFAMQADIQASGMQLVAAYPSASVLLVIEMPLVLAQAIMELARGRDPRLVKLGFRCCQLGEEVVPLGDEISFTKYVQELRDIPAAAAPSALDLGGQGSFLVTTANRMMQDARQEVLGASQREVRAFQKVANIHEHASLADFREAVRSARIWYYSGFDLAGLPLFFTEAAKTRERSDSSGKYAFDLEQDVHKVSMEEISAIVASAVAGGKLEAVVLNACNTLPLAEELISNARVPYVVCWEGRVLDKAAFVFGSTLASQVSAGVAHEVAFKRACEAVEAGGEWKLEEPQPSRGPQQAGRPFAAGVPRMLRSQAPVSLADLEASALQSSTTRKRARADDELSEGGMSSSSLSSSLTQLTQDSLLDRYALAYAHTSMHAWQHTHTYTYTYVRIDRHVHATCTCTCTCTCACACMYG